MPSADRAALLALRKFLAIAYAAPHLDDGGAALFARSMAQWREPLDKRTLAEGCYARPRLTVLRRGLAWHLPTRVIESIVW
ncbi:MAG: hypothetical protein JWM57_2593 [Phycisphaerales bacterium]|nr:hypothetical protein [Phycisphaerales bacterium]